MDGADLAQSSTSREHLDPAGQAAGVCHTPEQIVPRADCSYTGVPKAVSKPSAIVAWSRLFGAHKSQVLQPDAAPAEIAAIGLDAQERGLRSRNHLPMLLHLLHLLRWHSESPPSVNQVQLLSRHGNDSGSQAWIPLVLSNSIMLGHGKQLGRLPMNTKNGSVCVVVWFIVCIVVQQSNTMSSIQASQSQTLGIRLS